MYARGRIDQHLMDSYVPGTQLSLQPSALGADVVGAPQCFHPLLMAALRCLRHYAAMLIHNGHYTHAAVGRNLYLHPLFGRIYTLSGALHIANMGPPHQLVGPHAPESQGLGQAAG